MKKLVYGVGVNDAGYRVQWVDNGKKHHCKYYSVWMGIMERAFSVKLKKRRPTYNDIGVCSEWIYFSNFKKWMASQDWDGKAIDKDVIKQGNKIYAPEFCVFVEPKINSLIENKFSKTNMLGAVYDKNTGKYEARIRAGNKRIFLGRFFLQSEAHAAWQKAKADYIEQVAKEQTDERIKNGLMLRVHQLRDDLANGRETIKL